MITRMQAAIFDLDGVIVDTAKYHYLAWKRLANENGFDFTEQDNERLKGVSRTRSLEILLEIGGLEASDAARAQMAEQKNAWYVDSIRKLDASEILPGAAEYLRWLKECGVKTALGSASKNAHLILSRLGIADLFDVVIDGTMVSASKPDPEVFILAATRLGVDREVCVVFEDAEAGIEAAKRAGMCVVGIGKPEQLKQADVVIGGLHHMIMLLPDRVRA